MASESGHTSEQLEELFVQCKNPNRELRKKWGRDLGMDPRQIKLWFKNKTLLLKIEKQKQENDALREESERIRLENSRMIKELENGPKCWSCLRNEAVEDLLHENMKLREDHQRLSRIVGILQNLAGHDDGETQGFDDINLQLGLAPADMSHASDSELDSHYKDH